ARQVADDAAAERDDGVAAFEARGNRRIHGFLERLETLGLLAGRQHDARGLDAGGAKAGGQALQMEAGDVLVRDDRRADARQPRGDLRASTLDQTFADQDVVGAVAKADLDANDGGSVHGRSLALGPQSLEATASITSAAITSRRSSRVSTVTSAVA